MTLQVEARVEGIVLLASIYLQRHSRDVLNQGLPPIFMHTVRRSFNKLCARRRERLGMRLTTLYFVVSCCQFSMGGDFEQESPVIHSHTNNTVFSM